MGASESKSKKGAQYPTPGVAAASRRATTPAASASKSVFRDPAPSDGAPDNVQYLIAESHSVLYSDSLLPDQQVQECGTPPAADEFEFAEPSVPLRIQLDQNFMSVDAALNLGVTDAAHYNADGYAGAEELVCHSPVLRSYKNSFPGNNASFSALDNASQGSFSFIGGGSAAPKHNRFLEIAGVPCGLENYGNTCYANSIIQLIYHCAPLRLRLLELYDIFKAAKGVSGFEEKSVLYTLCALFHTMHKSNNALKKEDGKKSVSPLQFLHRVRDVNAFFGNEQQDAHEFCMFLLNDIMEAEKKLMANPKNAKYFADKLKPKSESGKPESLEAAQMSPLQVVLQGRFASITVCLNCERATYKQEPFLDLGVETRQGCSLLDCFKHIGDPSVFSGNNKLKCDRCKKLVNATNSIYVEQLPRFALVVHLKRFRYDPAKQNFAKTAHHVALPMEMDVEEYCVEESVAADTAKEKEEEERQRKAKESGKPEKPETPKAAPEAKQEEATGEDDDPFQGIKANVRDKLQGKASHKARFELIGFVAHLGEGPNIGHYFTCTRYGPNLWRRFDDESVTTMTVREVQQFFGVPIDTTGMVTTTAYILLYTRVA